MSFLPREDLYRIKLALRCALQRSIKNKQTKKKKNIKKVLCGGLAARTLQIKSVFYHTIKANCSFQTQ